ncbi:MAG: tetratricopeptide repeat-containing sensor histidine kinase [Chitinophagaceae bacterium]|nr:tetratricopeptide repeat-containing sensor histidine kinase [Chitinophagaceae bacterium]
MNIGNIYMATNPAKANEYFEKAIPIALNNNDNIRLGRLYVLNGFCYRIKDNFDNSLDNYLKAVKLYEKNNVVTKIGPAYINVADVYSDLKKFDKALEYYNKAETIILNQKDSFELSHLYFAKGIVFDKQGKFDTSIQYFTKAYNIGKILKNDMVITNSLSTIGIAHKNQGHIKTALNCYDTILSIYQKRNTNPDLWASLYINYGEAYAKGNDFTNAKAAFEKSLDYAKQAGTIDIEMSNYKSLSALYETKSDYKNEVYFLKKYHDLKDSLYNNDTKNKVTQLEADYQIEKKNAQIAKSEAATNKQKNQRNFFILLAGGAALLLMGLSFFYKKIKTQNTLLTDKNVLINKQKDELQTLNHVKDRLFSIISHDLRNPLVTLRSYLTLSDNVALQPEQKEKFKKQTLQAVSQTGDMLDNLLTWANMQIKNTAPQIVSVDIEDCVDDAILTAKAQAEQKGIQFNKSITTANAFGDTNILQIALRNLITNAVKYSNENSTITISSYTNKANKFISVKDEGIGMSKEKTEELLHNNAESTLGTQGEKGSGLGLFLVQELLNKINGKLFIESAPGKGSNFIIELPA